MGDIVVWLVDKFTLGAVAGIANILFCVCSKLSHSRGLVDSDK